MPLKAIKIDAQSISTESNTAEFINLIDSLNLGGFPCFSERTEMLFALKREVHVAKYAAQDEKCFIGEILVDTDKLNENLSNLRALLEASKITPREKGILEQQLSSIQTLAGQLPEPQKNTYTLKR